MTVRILNTTSFRMTIFSIIVLTASMLLLGLVFFYNARESMLRELRYRVEQEVEVLLFDYREDGLPELIHDIRERRNPERRNRLFYFLESKEGRVIFDDLPHIPRPNGWHEVALDPEAASDSILLYSLPLSAGYVLAVGASLDNLHAVQKSLLQALFSVLLLTILLGGVSGFFLSRRFLSRIDQLSRAADRIGSGNLRERLKRDGSGDDFDQLVATINRMLDRIEALVGSVKRVSASVAHELRTPIGHLKQNLEMLQQRGAGAQQRDEILEQSLAKVDEILEIFAALLRISELEAGELRAHFGRVDLSQLLAELVEMYDPVAEASGKTIVLDSHDPVHCSGDRRLLLQLFSNLLENALRYGGEGIKIEISLRLVAGNVVVTIADTGVGMTTPDRELATRKLNDMLIGGTAEFSKGLGFILVGAIGRLHGAAIKLRDNTPGLLVEITMPLVDEKVL